MTEKEDCLYWKYFQTILNYTYNIIKCEFPYRNQRKANVSHEKHVLGVYHSCRLLQVRERENLRDKIICVYIWLIYHYSQTSDTHEHTPSLISHFLLTFLNIQIQVVSINYGFNFFNFPYIPFLLFFLQARRYIRATTVFVNHSNNSIFNLTVTSGGICPLSPASIRWVAMSPARFLDNESILENRTQLGTIPRLWRSIIVEVTYNTVISLHCYVEKRSKNHYENNN